MSKMTNILSLQDLKDVRAKIFKGDAEAICYWKVLYGNYNALEMIEKLKKLANQGNALAQLNLGDVYSRGCEVEQDYKQALYWWKKSAEQGSALIQFNLGLVYEKGEGAEQDIDEAIKWFEKSAKQNNHNALNSLGNLYYKGEGVKQDYEKANELHRKSAEIFGELIKEQSKIKEIEKEINERITHYDK